MHKKSKTHKILDEGLWANINKKKKSGRSSSPKGSKAYKAAKKAGEKLERSKKSKMNEIASKYVNDDIAKLLETKKTKKSTKRPRTLKKKKSESEESKAKSGFQQLKGDKNTYGRNREQRTLDSLL